MTVADEIKAAASTLREVAAAATPGPWRHHDCHLPVGGHTASVLSGAYPDGDLRAWLPTFSHEPWDETRNVWADARYIATVHPQVGAAVAAWLESWTGVDLDEHAAMPADAEHALAVARAINQKET